MDYFHPTLILQERRDEKLLSAQNFSFCFVSFQHAQKDDKLYIELHIFIDSYYVVQPSADLSNWAVSRALMLRTKLQLLLAVLLHKDKDHQVPCHVDSSLLYFSLSYTFLWQFRNQLYVNDMYILINKTLPDQLTWSKPEWTIPNQTRYG